MKGDRIISGILVILLGIVFLLANLGIVSWSIFVQMMNLWPLLLIIAGVDIIFKSRVVTGIAWLLFFAVLIGYGLILDSRLVHIDSRESGKILYSKSPETTKAQLNLSLGGAKVDMGGTDAYLLYGEISPNNVKHSMGQDEDGKGAVIHVENEKGIKTFPISKQQNRYQLKLSEEVSWEIVADMGAIAGDMDLRHIPIHGLQLNVGAGNLRVNLGDKQEVSNVVIKAGASNLDIFIPKGVGLKINIEGALSKVNVDKLGLIQWGNEYISPNYEEVEKKINLNITVGVGKLDIQFL